MILDIFCKILIFLQLDLKRNLFPSNRSCPYYEDNVFFLAVNLIC